VTTLTPFFSKRNHEGFLFLSPARNQHRQWPSPTSHPFRGPGTLATTPTTTHRRHTSFFFFSNARDPLLHCLEPPIFQQQVSLPQVPRPARHAVVDASHHWKDHRREPNSANRLSSRFFSYARDTPDPGAPPSHATPLRPRVFQLRPPRAGLPPRHRYRL